jgi:hypothetical protein
MLAPTPSYAVISSPSGGGALLRTEPGAGTVLQALSNGLMVEVLPETETVGTVVWAHVRALGTIEGWVLQSVLTATTPTPLASTPSPTP